VLHAILFADFKGPLRPLAPGSKPRANVLFTRELARRAPELLANCFHLGVVRTGFGKNEDGIWKVVAPSAQAQDDNLARSLWEQSAQLVGLPAGAGA
jgi:hypothetical protein